MKIKPESKREQARREARERLLATTKRLHDEVEDRIRVQREYEQRMRRHWWYRLYERILYNIIIP